MLCPGFHIDQLRGRRRASLSYGASECLARSLGGIIGGVGQPSSADCRKWWSATLPCNRPKMADPVRLTSRFPGYCMDASQNTIPGATHPQGVVRNLFLGAWAAPPPRIQRGGLDGSSPPRRTDTMNIVVAVRSHGRGTTICQSALRWSHADFHREGIDGPNDPLGS